MIHGFGVALCFAGMCLVPCGVGVGILRQSGDAIIGWLGFRRCNCCNRCNHYGAATTAIYRIGLLPVGGLLCGTGGSRNTEPGESESEPKCSTIHFPPRCVQIRVVAADPRILKGF